MENEQPEIQAFRATIAELSMQVANLMIENNFLKIQNEELNKKDSQNNTEEG